MKRNNLFNRIFHSKELKAQKVQYEKAKALVGFSPETLQYIKEAKDLTQLLEAHKLAWRRGYQNENLAPCFYGMFRTENINTMKPEEVFLGTIWGLCTNNIPFWDNHKEETMAGNSFGISDDTKIYDLIMRQYRTLLCKNK